MVSYMDRRKFWLEQDSHTLSAKVPKQEPNCCGVTTNSTALTGLSFDTIVEGIPVPEGDDPVGELGMLQVSESVPGQAKVS